MSTRQQKQLERRIELNEVIRETNRAQSPLLKFPTELLRHVVQAYRPPVIVNGKYIYADERNTTRYESLRQICLTSKDLLPIAQEELFNRICIESDERAKLLTRSIDQSNRCREYAGKTRWMSSFPDLGRALLGGGAFNPRGLNLPAGEIDVSAINNLDKLQQLVMFFGTLHLDQPSLVLPGLSALDLGMMTISSATDMFNIRTSPSPFNVTNLPALRHLTLRSLDGIQTTPFERLFDTLIPQLKHLTLEGVAERDIKSMLNIQPPLSLEVLQLRLGDLERLTNSLMDKLILCDFKELRLEGDGASNNLGKLKELTEKNKFITKLRLECNIINVTESTLAGTLAEWNQFKKELEALCLANHIEVVKLHCIARESEGRIAWEG